MPYTSRIFGMLELELSKHLSFSFCGSNGEPLVECKALRVQDGFEFTIWARNDTGFPFKGIRGTIAPTQYARFASVDFNVPVLEALESVPLATIQGVILALPPGRTVLDHIATVSISAAADLSSIVFQEWDKPVLFAQPSATPSDATLRVSPLGGHVGLPRAAHPLKRLPTIPLSTSR